MKSRLPAADQFVIDRVILSPHVQLVMANTGEKLLFDLQNSRNLPLSRTFTQGMSVLWAKQFHRVDPAHGRKILWLFCGLRVILK